MNADIMDEMKEALVKTTLIPWAAGQQEEGEKV